MQTRGGCAAFIFGAALHALLLVAMSGARAQGTYSPVIITPPIVDTIDDNHVSIFSGKPQFTIPAVKLGDVSFTPFSLNGNHFVHGSVADHNYGSVVQCMSGTLGDEGTYQCSTAPGSTAIQAIYGEERATFQLQGSQWVPQAADGSSFVDNGATCTWTKRDGTQIVYAAFHMSGNVRCFSNNIASITYPDGRIATYYYYGSFSTTEPSPILSISTDTGYMLKYVYASTPVWGAESSVIAFNRAFQACDPSAVSCTLSPGWPAATLTWQDFTSTPCDGFPPVPGYPPCEHHILTIQDTALRKHVFELDSYYRVISYQPPDATAPVYAYKLCSLLGGSLLRNCFGYADWPPYVGVFQPQPLLLDLVQTVTRNGQDWAYSANFNPGGGAPPSYSSWSHGVTNPLGRVMGAGGNATPGTEIYWGPIEAASTYDGTFYQYERSVRNVLSYQQTPAGIRRDYSFDGRGNLYQLQQNAVPGSGLAPIIQSAAYPVTCSSIYSCNKPTSVTDANGNQTDFTYDPAHGGMLTETDPAVNGIRPQTRRTYVQRHAWYLDAAGTMIRDANPVWLLAAESYCRTSAASGSGCAAPNDETVTAYDYGPDSGPNNLLLRGKTVTADGQTHRTCTAHDNQGNKIWETSPNANPASCPDY